MANINQINSIVENLSDDQLAQQMQAPSAVVPQFLLLSELQRRQTMRAEAATPSVPPPTSTVAQDIMSGGVASLPQMSQGEAAPEGGVVGFASGGSPEDKLRKYRSQLEYIYGDYPQVADIPMDEGGYADNLNRFRRMVDAANPHLPQVVDLPTSPNPSQQFSVGEGSGSPAFPNSANKPQKGYIDRVKDQFSNSFNMPDPDRPFGQVVGDAISRGVKGAYEGSSLQRGLNEIDNEVGRSQREILKIPGAIDQWAGDVQRYHYGNDKTKSNVVDLNLGDVPPEPGMPAAPRTASSKGDGIARRGVGSSGGIAAVGAAKGITPPNAEAPDLRAKYPEVKDPTIADPDEYYEKMRQKFPDQYADLLARQDQRLAENSKGRGDALNTAMMEAGLGIMSAGARGGSFLGAIGDGGIGALKGYTQQMNAVRDRGDKIGQRREELMLAQEAAKRGDYKSAAEMADRHTNRNIQLHESNRKERHDNMSFDADMWKTKAMLDKTDKQIAAQERIAQMQVDGTIKAAGIRAGGSGAGGVKPPSAKDIAKMVRDERNDLAKSMQYMGMPLDRLETLAKQNVYRRLEAQMQGIGALPEVEYAGELTSKGFLK